MKLLCALGPGHISFVLLCPDLSVQHQYSSTFGHLSPAEEHALYFQIPFMMKQFNIQCNPLQKENVGDYMQVVNSR